LLAPLSRGAFDRLELLKLQGMAPLDEAGAFVGLQAPRLRSLVLETLVSLATLNGLAANRVIADSLEHLTLRGSMSARRTELPIDELALPKLRHALLERTSVGDGCIARLRARGVEVELC
jgi:hypothetical protein